MKNGKRKNWERKYSAKERTGLIINLTFKTAAKLKRGKPKLKAENGGV